MSRAIRIAIGSAALVAGLAVAGASPASAQVRVWGSFPVPHGRVSVNIGGGGYGYGGYGYGGYGAFPIGGYVPYGYEVYQDPSYGWGFVYGDQWIACEPRGSQFIIIAAPVFYGGYGYRPYGYRAYGYRNYGYGYRNYGYRNYGYVRPYRNDRYYSQDRNYRGGDRSGGRNDRRDSSSWNGSQSGSRSFSRDGSRSGTRSGTRSGSRDGTRRWSNR